eukprot:gnl/MRDRNA2_/MRDRNA2_310940_c0_seq1.p1 gnl/MRDRNA2_/MRDRNA2_310940_c0~~gnl/MRDRNA2_/MRDRNA2_310940_c0_seq1.p1  ORF type:complete len:115 (+),score=25.52 gnl/MRDRNA2_/MRDRNA2_310940_c0_seq1:50-346(+)
MQLAEQGRAGQAPLPPCTVVTVAVDGELVTCTSMAGEQIVPPMPIATSTLGDVKLAVSKTASTQRVELVSVEGQVLVGVDTLLIAEALLIDKKQGSRV